MDLQLLILLAFISCCYSMRQQSVAVSGRLMCGNQPAAGVKVKLWDEDDGPDPDDVLDEQFTDETGAFLVKLYIKGSLNFIIYTFLFTLLHIACPYNLKFHGSERELTNIDPVLKIYHDCDDGILPGQRKLKFYIPDSYISAGGMARKVFNLGFLNLETIFPGEERDLF